MGLNPDAMKLQLFTLLFLLYTLHVAAYNYGEHKAIGDRAFARFIAGLQAGNQVLPAYMDFEKVAEDDYLLTGFAAGNTAITYGVLNALSGDHESNPLLLEEQIRNSKSVIHKIIALHNQYLELGYTAAPDGKLAKLDIRYALFAASNLSHFYEYNKTMAQQLRHFDTALIRLCQSPGLVAGIFKKLDRTNALNMYVTLHGVAMDLAEQGGSLARQGRSAEARTRLFYALLFNAFADHFLEDAFAAGHLVVNRSVLASFTNNKALHDFYCEHGCTVTNSKGEVWHAYGDGQFNVSHHAWQQKQSLDEIRYDPYTPEAERVIEAVYRSLIDIRNAFDRAYVNPGYIPFVCSIPADPRRQPQFLLDHIPALALVPVPYHAGATNPALHPGGGADTAGIRKATLPLQHRNFVRSRVANSLVLSTIGPMEDRYYRGLDFRINAGNFSRRFAYNSKGGKKGMLDYWHGYTVSYSWVQYDAEEVQQGKTDARYVKLGIRSNYDYWVSDRKFVGLYSYAEAGLQFSDRKARFIFTPSAGIQFASLFNLNYYNMPIWLRLPLQYLLPLKLRLGALLSPGYSPRYFSAVDLDILF